MSNRIAYLCPRRQALTNHNIRPSRPIALLILAGLTLALVLPFVVDIVMRDPLEVSFVYPKPDRPQLGFDTFLFLLVLLVIAQVVAFIGAIIVGIGLLKKQRWAWYFALGLHVLVFLAHLLATLLLAPYETAARIGLMIISASSIYLLSRKDVKHYLRPAKA